MSNEKIELVGKECKFVTHIPAIPGYRRDTHIIKEALHYSDGSVKPNLKVVYDFKKPFWVTKPIYQKHKDKRESEDLDRVDEYYSSESDLAKNVASRLGPKYVGVKDLRMVKSSPYVYGLDVSASTIIKHMYMNKYPAAISKYTVATLDIEYDIMDEIITIVSLADDTRLYTVITEEYAKLSNINMATLEADVDVVFNKYMPDTDIQANRTRTIKVVKNELMLIKEIFKVAHSWKPDFLAIWNIEYEITKFLEVLDKYKINPADIFTDPSLPKELKYFKYTPAAVSKKKESGDSKPLDPQERWHVIKTCASFYMIDAMASYNFVRVGGKQVAGGYNLPNILNKELGDKLGKLKFEDLTDTQDIEWHLYMSRERPIEYIVYNMRDVTSMLDLESKTKDLTVSLPLLCGVSSFDIFSKGPRRIVDGIYFFYLSKGKVIGTKPPIMDNDKILGLGGWINILPSRRINEIGLRILEENPELRTNTVAHTYDADKHCPDI